VIERADYEALGRGQMSGAIEFLTKPFRDQDLLDAIQVGFIGTACGGKRPRMSRVYGRVTKL
jgi:FixJ family two-component response regulator